MKRSTMMILITIMCFLMWFSPSIAGDAPAAENPKDAAATPNTQPQIMIPDPLFTFENVVDGTEVVHDFPIYNQGTGDLEIAKVQTG